MRNRERKRERERKVVLVRFGVVTRSGSGVAMAPSANGQKPPVQHRVYIVERRAEFRELNSQIDPSADQQPYEPEISYLDFAYLDEKQAYAIAIREQILELDENGRTHDGRKIAAQTNLSLKERLKSIHKVVDVAAEAHEDPEAPVVKFEVLEFPLAPVQPFQEGDLLKELGDQSDSEDIEDEEEEELGDEDDGDEEDVEEEVDEGEEGVEEEEVEGEEEEDEDEEGEDDLEDLDDEDEGEEVDDDEDDSDAEPQTKKQRK